MTTHLKSGNAVAGEPVVDHLMAGFNCSIFCYGQTGSGKTHTMIGGASDTDEARNSILSWLLGFISISNICCMMFPNLCAMELFLRQ